MNNRNNKPTINDDVTSLIFLDLPRVRRCVPVGTYMVDAQALQKARTGVPKGEYHIDTTALQQARRGVPVGEYH
jgi:hypothetical protein